MGEIPTDQKLGGQLDIQPDGEAVDAVGVEPAEVLTHTWQVGDLGYRKVYEGRVEPYHVFRVINAEGDQLKVNYAYSEGGAGWVYNTTDVRRKVASECSFMSPADYQKMLDSQK